MTLRDLTLRDLTPAVTRIVPTPYPPRILRASRTTP